MTEYKIRNIREIEAYSGPHSIPGIQFRPAREALGVRAWGMSVLELDRDCANYPEHDHKSDGHEEVYLVLEGSASLLIGADTVVLRQGDFVHVPPKLRRKFVTTDERAVVLAIGGTPGKPYSQSMGG